MHVNAADPRVPAEEVADDLLFFKVRWRYLQVIRYHTISYDIIRYHTITYDTELIESDTRVLNVLCTKQSSVFGS